MTYRLTARAHREQQVVDLLQQAHAAGRSGVPLPELRRRLGLKGWQVLDRLTGRGLIGIDDGIIYLLSHRPIMPLRLPPNVIRFRRRPAPPRPAPVPPPPPDLPPAA